MTQNILKHINDVIDFATNKVKAEISTVPQARIVAGVAGHVETTINTKTLNHYTDPTEQFFAGIWQSSVGANSINYTEEELCTILEGRVRLTDLNGNAKEFGAGNTFVIPSGFKGTWETLAPVKKIAVMWQTK
jgi:uncharacterized cupin superfamily protein